MATAFQIGAFQWDAFQIEGGAPAFVPPYYWKMVTQRPVAAATAQVRQDVVTFKAQIGLSAAFPIILGGTEVLRRLKPAAATVQARQTVESGTLALGLSATFPITLGGTEKPRRLQTATRVVNPSPPRMS